jgi:hypothetical protein
MWESGPNHVYGLDQVYLGMGTMPWAGGASGTRWQLITVNMHICCKGACDGFNQKKSMSGVECKTDSTALTLDFLQPKAPNTQKTLKKFDGSRLPDGGHRLYTVSLSLSLSLSLFPSRGTLRLIYTHPPIHHSPYTPIHPPILPYTHNPPITHHPSPTPIHPYSHTQAAHTPHPPRQPYILTHTRTYTHTYIDTHPYIHHTNIHPYTSRYRSQPTSTHSSPALTATPTVSLLPRLSKTWASLSVRQLTFPG